MVFGGALHQFVREIGFVADVALRLAALHAIQRRLRDVHVAAFNQFLHVAEEKSEQQGADVTAVHVRVGHQNDFVVTRFFDVKDFALERENRLIFAVAAHFCGAASGFALDHEQFAARRIAFLAIGEFPRQAARIHRGFAARKLASFASRFAGARGFNALANNAAGYGGVLVEPFAEALVDELLDVALDVAVELAFGLAFKLRLGQAHADDRDETFADVVAADADLVLLLFEHAGGGSKVVDRTRQSGAKAGEMGAAINGVDGVRKRKNIFAVGVVVLHRDFDFDGPALTFHVNRRIVQRGFAAVEMLDEFGDAAGKTKLRALLGALVGERDFQALVQEREFAKALRQRVEAEGGLIENGSIRVKRDFRSRFTGFSGLLQLGSGLAFFVGLLPNAAVPRNFQLQPIRERVDHGDADAVQAAGNLVGFAVELSARAQHSEDDFRGGALFRGVHVDGDAAAVVNHRDGIIGVHRDIDFVGVAGHRFVDRIVDHFPYQMVQTQVAGRADVHRGAQAHGFDAAEHSDGFRVVLMARSFSDYRLLRFFLFVAHSFS